jgi:hypothetical protein
MSPKRLARAALLGLVAGAAATAGACSLILPAGDLDAQYGVDAGGAGPGTSTSTSTGTVASSSSGTVASSSSGTSASSSSGAGGGEPGCCAGGGCANDSANCGTCGHVCPPGSTCDNGRCPAGPLGPAGAKTFSCGEGAVYWYDGENTQRMPVDGGALCTCASGIGTDAIGVAAQHVVVGTYDPSAGRRVFAWPAVCCDQPEPPVPIADSAPWKGPAIALELGVGFTTDGTNVYWLDDFDVMRVPLGGGTPEPVYAWDHDAEPPPAPGGLAVTGTSIVVNASQMTTIYGLSTAGQVRYQEPAQYNSAGVRTNGTYVVWASENHGVYLMPVTGATPSELGSFSPTGVAIDEGYAYAIDGTNRLVLRWALADPDAGPTTIETLPDASAPSMLCADGPNLFWLAAGGTIVQGDKNPP